MLTLYRKKGLWQKFVGIIKPYLKYVITIDMGIITYENEFQKLIEDNGLKINHLERIKGDNGVLLNLFKMNVVEAIKAWN